MLTSFFGHVFGQAPDMLAAATAPDPRILIDMAKASMGWSVLPNYLSAEALAAGHLVDLATTRAGPDNTLYLVWNKAALRHLRIVHVRDVLPRAASSG